MGTIIRSIKLVYPLEETVEDSEPDLPALEAEHDDEILAIEINETADPVDEVSQANVPIETSQANLPTNIAAAPDTVQVVGDRTTRQAAQRCRAWLKRVCSDELAHM